MHKTYDVKQNNTDNTKNVAQAHPFSLFVMPAITGLKMCKWFIQFTTREVTISSISSHEPILSPLLDMNLHLCYFLFYKRFDFGLLALRWPDGFGKHLF